MLVIPHKFKKTGLHNLVVRRIFSDILLVLGLKKVEKHWYIGYVAYRLCRFTSFVFEFRKLQPWIWLQVGTVFTFKHTIPTSFYNPNEKEIYNNKIIPKTHITGL
jgi:hypothetical protein